jgi:alpha-tubulin suppressor-like RCC1 family protein
MLACGKDHCAVVASGGVYTWGKGAEGQLGHGLPPIDDDRVGGGARQTPSGESGKGTRARRRKGDTGPAVEDHTGRDDQLVPARYACMRLRVPCLRMTDEVYG